ncbi:MAG: penicillin-binding transpeptidase domain-containing protein, partial [Candidatus Margulisiibacteriota bacterium]
MRGINAKLWIVFSFIFIAFVVVDIRLGYLQIIKHDFYKKKSRAQMQRIVTLSPERGEILDRNGVALATSVKAYSIYADLFEMKDRTEVANLLAQNLSSYNTRMWNRMTHFVWVKRKASLDVKESLTVKGLHFLPDVRRMYPFRERAGQILGFVNVDDQGLSGLEYYFNYHLNGKPGTLILESDAQGKSMYSYNQKIVPAKNGKKLQLTIDHHIQFMMENQLQKSVDSLQAEGGLAILMDIHSGEILGMANYPFFDPNRYYDYKDTAIFKNNAIQMAFEPGSV